MVRFLGSNEEAGCAGSVLLGRASLGVVVDPLKIPSLEKMGTADQVGERLLKAELEKEITLEAEMVRYTIVCLARLERNWATTSSTRS